MIQGLILVCMALTFARRTDAKDTSTGDIIECQRVMSAIYNCSEKYEYYLPEEFFKRVKSDWFVEEAWRCIDDSTPTREAARGCDSEVAVCMAEFLQRPLAYLQRAFQSTM
ncbi:uncharacterized protein [Dermacentor albipictus]|uniref:uncharacterized protein isoform X4 n=1 Tax=Dermacentor albipictus TaxID=60249 RepID=UPI0038FC32D6